MAEFDEFGKHLTSRFQPERSDFEKQLRGQRLTTTEVIFYMPDHPVLLQRFMWQTLDLPPEFPRVHRFLDFWRREIDAVIQSVTCSAVGLVTPAKLNVGKDLNLTLH